MSYSQEKTKEFTSEDFALGQSARMDFLETSLPLEQAKADRGSAKEAPGYSLGFRVVVGLLLATLLFVAAIYYGIINP